MVGGVDDDDDADVDVVAVPCPLSPGPLSPALLFFLMDLEGRVLLRGFLGSVSFAFLLRPFLPLSLLLFEGKIVDGGDTFLAPSLLLLLLLFVGGNTDIDRKRRSGCRIRILETFVCELFFSRDNDAGILCALNRISAVPLFTEEDWEWNCCLVAVFRRIQPPRSILDSIVFFLVKKYIKIKIKSNQIQKFVWSSLKKVVGFNGLLSSFLD